MAAASARAANTHLPSHSNTQHNPTGTEMSDPLLSSPLLSSPLLSSRPLLSKCAPTCTRWGVAWRYPPTRRSGPTSAASKNIQSICICNSFKITKRVVSVHNYIGRVLGEVDEVMLLGREHTKYILPHPRTPYHTPSSSTDHVLKITTNTKQNATIKSHTYYTVLSFLVEIHFIIFLIQVIKNASLFVFWPDV